MLWKTIGKEGGGKLSARLKEKMCVCACDCYDHACIHSYGGHMGNRVGWFGNSFRELAGYLGHGMWRCMDRQRILRDSARRHIVGGAKATVCVCVCV